MTIEFSLRRKAARSRFFSALWLGSATIILIVAFISFPTITETTLLSISQIESRVISASSPSVGTAMDSHIHLLAMGALGIEAFIVLFACFLLSRMAFLEIELAARFTGIADALCVAGGDFDQFERAVNLLVPDTKYFSFSEVMSEKSLKSLTDLIKQLKS